MSPTNYCISHLLAWSIVFLFPIEATGCRSGDHAPPAPTVHLSDLPDARQGVLFVSAPAAGSVAAIVRQALDEAATKQRTLVVYVGATWCEPCQRFHEAARRGELDATFPALTLLEFDTDRDNERLASADYVSTYIPLFALPRSDGLASGKQVEGGIKGDGAVGFIVPRLQALLAQ